MGIYEFVKRATRGMWIQLAGMLVSPQTTLVPTKSCWRTVFFWLSSEVPQSVQITTRAENSRLLGVGSP